jgi:uncharacterized protein YigE (DUF2233 family)
MKRWGLVCAMVLTLAALGAAGAMRPPSAPAAGETACHRQTFEGDAFTVCVYRRGRDELRLVSRMGDGPVSDFRRLGVALRKDERRVRFAMNAGMYDPGRKAVGLLIEDGRLIHAINTREGPGNFHLLPNGAFAVDREGRASIVESRALAARGVGGLRWATQSGPLLVAGGRFHPAIQPNGESRLIRNAVGVRSPDEAVFVISDGAVSFGRLARFLRDGLGCQDALYLDGYVSSLWAPELRRRDGAGGLGPMVVVQAKTG